MTDYRLTVAAIALLAMPAPATAQELEWIDQAYERYRAEAPYADNVAPLDWFAGRVNQGQAWSLTFVPQQSGTYRFPGACDHDCTIMHITVFDYRGNEVTQRSGASGSTTASAYLTEGQSYRVQYYPEDCSAAFCFSIGAIIR